MQLKLAHQASYSACESTIVLIKTSPRAVLAPHTCMTWAAQWGRTAEATFALRVGPDMDWAVIRADVRKLAKRMGADVLDEGSSKVPLWWHRGAAGDASRRLLWWRWPGRAAMEWRMLHGVLEVTAAALESVPAGVRAVVRMGA